MRVGQEIQTVLRLVAPMFTIATLAKATDHTGGLLVR
jgi:hypothetical protein